MSFCDRRGVAQRRFAMGCTEGQEALSGQAFDGDEWADWEGLAMSCIVTTCHVTT
jgi:hypothetical protein